MMRLARTSFGMCALAHGALARVTPLAIRTCRAPRTSISQSGAARIFSYPYACGNATGNIALVRPLCAADSERHGGMLAALFATAGVFATANETQCTPMDRDDDNGFESDDRPRQVR